jgi:plasmid maintenance system killer protein
MALAGAVGGGGVRILHWLEISNFKSFRSFGLMPLEGQVSRFGGFASVALRKLAILDAAGCLNDLSIPPGNRLEPLRSPTVRKVVRSV